MSREIDGIVISENDSYSEYIETIPDPILEKIAEATYVVETASTSAVNVGTIAAGSDAWTSDKILYVKIRDTAGKRNGYFYGTDAFFVNPNPINESSANFTGARFNFSVDSDGKYQGFAGSTTTHHGIGPTYVASTGDIPITARASSNSGIIGGTYKVEVFLISTPFELFT